MTGIQQAATIRPLPTKSYIGSAANASNLTTYTFSSVSLGTEPNSRYVVVCVGGWSGSTATRTVSSLTIGGISATALTNPATQYAGAIYGLNVAARTTADIVVTFSAVINNAVIFVYAVDNLNSTTAVDAKNSFLSSASSTSVTPTTSPNGIVIAHAFAGPSATSISSWSGVTQDFASTIETAPEGAASAVATSTSLTATVNTQAASSLNFTAISLF